MCYIFGDAVGDPVADQILHALKQAYPNGLAQSEISHDMFSRNHKAQRLNAAFDILRESGRARCEKRQTRGRPAEVWFAADPQQELVGRYDINDLDDLNPFNQDASGNVDVEVLTSPTPPFVSVESLSVRATEAGMPDLINGPVFDAPPRYGYPDGPDAPEPIPSRRLRS